MRRAALGWLPALLWMAALFVASSRPPAATLSSVRGADKLAHFAAYAVLGALLVVPLGRHRWPVAVALGATYGVIDELHQALRPLRHADPWDSLADAAGALAGAWLAGAWRTRADEGRPL